MNVSFRISRQQRCGDGLLESIRVCTGFQTTVALGPSDAAVRKADLRELRGLLRCSDVVKQGDH